TASILSKKLAAGLQSLVLDVKTGNAAFMAERQDAVALAKSLVEVAGGAGLASTALITDMNEPLATAAGNAVEVQNAVDFLTGRARDARLAEVTLALAAEMLVAASLAPDADSGREQTLKALDSGMAAERFGRMVAELGGPADFVERAEHYLPQAPMEIAVKAGRSGFVGKIDTRGLGLAVGELGGGRRRPEDAVDHAVGLTRILPIGTEVREGDALAFVHARSEADAECAAKAVRNAYGIVEEPPAVNPPILDKITA